MIDLHTHSCFSDGTDTPSQLVTKASLLQLEAIALCDHNTVAGLDEFLAAGRQSTIETIPGAELTAEFENTEVHILALFLPKSSYGAIAQYVAAFRKAKEESNRQLFAQLAADGFLLDEERIFQDSTDYVNRAVFASELTRLGHTPSIEEAFQTLLAPENGYYTPAPRPDALETISFIRSIGAVPVLAHPLDSMDTAQLRRFLPKAASTGLIAMETYYSKYDATTTSLACQLANEFGLKPSGGSDYHGERKPDVLLGYGRNNLSIPCTILDDLRP